MAFSIQFVTPRDVSNVTVWVQIPESFGFTAGGKTANGGASILGAVCIGQIGIGFDDCVFQSSGIIAISFQDIIPLDKIHENVPSTIARYTIPGNTTHVNDFPQNVIASYPITNSFDTSFPPMVSGSIVGLCADGGASVVVGFEFPSSCLVTKTPIDGAATFSSCIVLATSLLGAEAIARCAAEWNGCQLVVMHGSSPTSSPGSSPGGDGIPPPPVIGAGPDCEIQFYKHPADVRDFTFNWGNWLSPSDALFASAWSVGSGLTIGSTSLSGSKTTVWISGGADGSTYILRNSISTFIGRKELRSAQVIVMVCHTAPPDPPLTAKFELERVFVKAPANNTTVQLNWGDWLAGDFIQTSVWSADPGITISGSTFTRTVTSVRVAGGVAGTNYNLTNTITTQLGRVETRHVLVEVEICGPTNTLPPPGG